MAARGDLSEALFFSWRYDGAVGAAGSIVVWDDTDLALAVLPDGLRRHPPGPVVIRPIEGAVRGAAGILGPSLSRDERPARSADPGRAREGPRCQQLVGTDVVAAGFSPDAQFMYWMVQPSGAQAQLWIAAGDGTGARMLGSGEISEAHFIGDGGARLEMILDGELVWLDLHDASAALHHVAEQVHGAIYDIAGGQWLIMGYQWNATDGTVTLALINRDDSQVRPISPSVISYEVSPPGSRGRRWHRRSLRRRRRQRRVRGRLRGARPEPLGAGRNLARDDHTGRSPVTARLRGAFIRVDPLRADGLGGRAGRRELAIRVRGGGLEPPLLLGTRS